MKTEQQMRFIQINFVVALLLFIWIGSQLPGPQTGRLTTAADWLAVFYAIYSATVYFWVPRNIARRAMRPRRSGRQSTPLKRWWVGHLIRFSSALSVGLAGFVLHLLHGAGWLVDALYGTGLVLLLICRPGMIAIETGA